MGSLDGGQLPPRARRHAESALEMPRHVALVGKTAFHGRIHERLSQNQQTFYGFKPAHDQIAVRARSECLPELSGQGEAIEVRQSFKLTYSDVFRVAFL